jgi:hypothetical protein
MFTAIAQSAVTALARLIFGDRLQQVHAADARVIAWKASTSSSRAL